VLGRAKEAHVTAEHESAPSDAALLGTAAQHASRRVPTARRDETVDELLTRLRGRRFDSASVVAVCDRDRLVGLVTIERLLGAVPGQRIGAVMDADPPTVAPHTDQEHAAWTAVRHGEPGLAVVDDRGRYQGLISAQALLAVLLEEHDEDLARIGGFLGSAAQARSASTEPVPRRLWHRLPWLLLGLAGALAAAAIVGVFEQELEEQVLIAYFVPGVVYIADAVGTQTEALVIRGLSLGIGVRRILGAEVLTGLLLGVLLGGLALPLVWLLWGDPTVSLAVAIAIVAASSIATLVALGLPYLLHRLRRDPAFGSGPLATVVQDLLSVLIYFVTASLLLG
jgi:magnesium transporter